METAFPPASRRERSEGTAGDENPLRVFCARWRNCVRLKFCGISGRRT